MQVTSTNSATTASQSTSGSNLGNKDTFLKLLVAQMQNQDPLKPQDPTAMTAQLAQFNMVEQQLNTNKLLTNISSSMGSANNQASLAASYLGHTAVVNGSSLTYDGATPQNIIVQTSQSAGTAKVQVLDSNGQLVKTLNNSPLAAGSNTFTWDGTTDAATQAPAGQYFISVSATDLGGNRIGTQTQITGQVQAVTLGTNGGVQLVVNGTAVNLANVQEIRM
jgi:flagellar basal-body rod modification protein FlgD